MAIISFVQFNEAVWISRVYSLSRRSYSLYMKLCTISQFSILLWIKNVVNMLICHLMRLFGFPRIYSLSRRSYSLGYMKFKKKLFPRIFEVMHYLSVLYFIMDKECG
jgi:hypothetical protein